MSKHPIVALDVGGSSIKSSLVAVGPKIVGDVSIHPIDSQGSAAEILETFATVITGYLENCRDSRCIAMAFPGPFDYERGICWMENQDKYDALYGLNVSERLREILGIPGLEIRYCNDAEAAILGEAIYGAGAVFPRLLGLTLGTGLGSAFVVNGIVVTEGAGVPDQGWLYLQPFGSQRADDVFSTRGLLARLKEHGIQADELPSAIAVANKHDHTLKETFVSFGMDLGLFLKPFVSAFRADGVLVTGGLSEAWDLFALSLRQSLPVPVVKGKLGRYAPLLGAAELYF
ncbi:MAG: ROK family protein [Chloroflexota bacterium]|nr:ROK family protein [Chloroflexota bacterium]